MAAEVSDVLRDAAWGRTGWEEACRRLAEALPGSAPTITNYDLPRQAINATFWNGIDPDYMESYRNHYASVNPWVDFWTGVPAGVVSISERDSPSSAFRDSEFYVDWLAPQGNMKAAVGTRLDVDRHNTIHVAWHYDIANADSYDAPAAAILEGTKSRLIEAVQTATLLRDGLEGGQRLGSLIERIEGAAILVDRDRKIREANAEASATLREGEVLAATGNGLSLRDPAAQRWFEEAVARLADGLPVAAHSTVFGADERIFRISVTRAPDHAEPGFALLVRPRPLVLVVVRMLVGGQSRLDEAGLRFAFGLSRAEFRLCEVLANGRSLAQAAEILGISDGTVRQRVKTVFQKTGTHRQGELVAVLGRFRIAE